MNQPLTSPLPAARTAASRTSLATRATRACATAAALLLTALLLAVLTPAAARAHAGLVSSDPAEGATLRTVPQALALEFSEPVEAPAYVVVTGPDGATHQLGDPQVTGPAVSQPLDPATLAAGRTDGAWTIAYRVVSSDGHAVQGHVRFRVSSSAPVESAQPGQPASTAMPSDPSDAPSSIPTPASVATQSPDDTAGTSVGDEGDSGLYLLIGAAALVAVAAAAIRVRRNPDRSPDRSGPDQP